MAKRLRKIKRAMEIHIIKTIYFFFSPKLIIINIPTKREIHICIIFLRISNCKLDDAKRRIFNGMYDNLNGMFFTVVL